MSRSVLKCGTICICRCVFRMSWFHWFHYNLSFFVHLKKTTDLYSSISALCSLTYTTPLPPPCSHVFWQRLRAWGWWNQGRRRRRRKKRVGGCMGGQPPSAPLPFPLLDLSGRQPGSNVEMWLAGVDLIKSAHVSLQRGDSRLNHP